MKKSQSCLLSAHGAPCVVFHGTRAGVISRFEPHIRRGEQIGFGIHFAFEADFAKQYAHNPNVARRGKSPAVMAANVSAENPLIADQIVYEGSQEFALALKLAGRRMIYPKDEQGRRAVYLQNALDTTSPERALRLLVEAGYDAVIYRAKLSSATPYGYHTSQESRCISVFHPDQVSRTWAAPDIMAITPKQRVPDSLELSL